MWGAEEVYKPCSGLVHPLALEEELGTAASTQLCSNLKQLSISKNQSNTYSLSATHQIIDYTDNPIGIH